MIERPILMNGEMVRRTLDGSKTHTRRIVKLRRFDDMGGGWPMREDEHGDWFKVECPYGAPGDRLYVRETWRAAAHFDSYSPTEIGAFNSQDPTSVWYEADGSFRECSGDDGSVSGKTRVSIHMPRWASRITLEVVSVRVEKLIGISRDDAMREGIERAPHESGDPLVAAWRDYLDDSNAFFGNPVASFASLWRSINGIESWDANPWVWVVDFKRVTP